MNVSGLNTKSVVIIGAGPAGLTAAYHLAKSGLRVRVIEASPYVGGLSRSLDLWGQTVDLGPHRFYSKDESVTAFWREILGDNYTVVPRLTRIYYQHKFFKYPLELADSLRVVGVLPAMGCIVSYCLSKFQFKKPSNFEEWVTKRFGRRLFEIFFKTYTEKVWGIACRKIDADWAAQRIKELSLSAVIGAAFFKPKAQKHLTLLDWFLYPNGGSGTVYQRMQDKIIALGGTVELSTQVETILTATNAGDLRAVGVRLKDGRELTADCVISTMPLTQMVKGLPNCPKEVLTACDQLYYRNTILVYLNFDHDHLFPDNWLYIQSPGVLHGRITNFRNWCPSINNGKSSTILCLEYWCFDRDALWQKPTESLAELANEEVRKLGLIPNEVKCLASHVEKLRRSYPVYEKGYKAHLAVIQQYLQKIQGIFPIGRYGSFKYNNQDHSILMGILVAEAILKGTPLDLSKVNTGSNYLENARFGKEPFANKFTEGKPLAVTHQSRLKILHPST